MKKHICIAWVLGIFICMAGCNQESTKSESYKSDKNSSTVINLTSSIARSNSHEQLSSQTVEQQMQSIVDSIIKEHGGNSISQQLERESVGIHFAGEQKNRTLKVGEEKLFYPILSPRVPGTTYNLKAKCEPEGIVDFKQENSGGYIRLTAKKVGTCKVTVTVTSPMKEGSATDDITVTVTE